VNLSQWILDRIVHHGSVKPYVRLRTSNRTSQTELAHDVDTVAMRGARRWRSSEIKEVQGC
jgi:hypothetical protein